MINHQPETKLPFFYKPSLPLRLDIQFFADEDEQGGGNQSAAVGDEDNPQPAVGDEDNQQQQGQLSSTITLTEEELQKRLQSETDKRVTEAIKKREESLRKEMEEKIKIERKEAEELAKLTADERAKFESEKEKAQLQKEKDALEEERKAFQHERLFLETEKALTNESLDDRLAPFLIGEDAEKTYENIKIYKEIHQEAVQKEVNEILKGKKPLIGGKQNLSEIEQLESERQDALKRKDLATAVALKNKIHQLNKK
ncbi:hypothetical protein AWH48_11520 [Domibacillus aminovorans]|uniref:DUF4355 domain-containing protein n=1 Tax=Domibacillus aminovorans TaxID=29332 RepID=A0A177KKG2_9BACI|nr:DUF4355 domain-containing protein [Domibacillus aminovorans]OAH53890.1 hypothetical protein AWH48_11520 [Domibacillus aminovorans]